MSEPKPSGLDAPTGVLICDDNTAMRALLGLVVGLSPRLHVVGEATDGIEAVAEARRHQPDVILLDLAMPKRNGLEALPELRTVAPDARIIVFSGFATAAVADQVLALGASSYLEKGATPDAILAAIEKACPAEPASQPALPVAG